MENNTTEKEEFLEKNKDLDFSSRTITLTVSLLLYTRSTQYTRSIL